MIHVSQWSQCTTAGLFHPRGIRRNRPALPRLTYEPWEGDGCKSEAVKKMKCINYVIYIYVCTYIYICIYIYYYMIQYVENKMNEQGKIRKVLSWCKSGSKHGKEFFHWLLHRNSCWPAVPNPLYWQYSPSNIKQPRVEAVSRVPQKQAKKQHVC